MNESKPRILLIDDEPSITELLKLNLEQTGGFVVMTENNSLSAIATAETFRPDLIILDVMMPGLDGGRLACILQARPTMKEVPLVFLTAAVTRDEVLLHQGDLGGMPFLAKPVNLQEVLSCLEVHLGG